MLRKKHRSLDVDFEGSKKLLIRHLIDGSDVITPAKLHHITDESGCSVYKFEAYVDGLRPSQWPRVWLAVSDHRLINRSGNKVPYARI